MKRIILKILVALFTAGFIACNGTPTKNNNTNTQTDTSVTHQTLARDEIYTCKMHQDVMSDKPGKCPECGMTLVKQKTTPAQQKMMKEGTYENLKTKKW